MFEEPQLEAEQVVPAPGDLISEEEFAKLEFLLTHGV